MKRLKLFLLNTIILVFCSIILKIIGIYFNVYVSNKIGTEMLGVFQLVMSVYFFGINLAMFGINLATTRIVSEELALGNTYAVKKITKKCIYISLISGIITSSLFFLNTDFILTSCLHNKVSKTVIYFFCLALPLISMSSAIHGYFTAVRRVYKTASGQFVEQITKIAITVFLLNLFLPKGIDYACYSLILGDLISEIISFIYIYILYLLDKKRHLSSSGSIDTKDYNKRIFRISIPVAITSYIRSGLSTLKQIIIPTSLEKSGINCSEALSKYGIITGMAMPIITFPDILIRSFSGLLIPEFSRYFAKKDYKSIKKYTSILLLATGFFSVLLTILLYLFSNQLAFIIYKDISISYYIKILAPLSIFIYLDTIIDSILRGLDAQVGVMVINIIDLILSVSFIYFCVPIIGLKGYIISIYISEILNFIISMSLLVKDVYLKK